ncbi:hypothetical protein [Nocardioides lianchengensis]|uniref:Uncharacterized protein n=1 Tax=Nocardioides lianchengensis TaxID=1045774 RepID=A0A1G6LT10_9ACTN|nr:hypothetical protein [Nocardioides lianchengensis]NYG12451.1 hypothetical protein [Nocardioides lianchengensis]SDC46428.1 hypothetical protein SAMN05421872_102353 [Nocardioides lianchengensis]
MASVDDLVQRRPARKTRPPVTATVTTSDDSGVYATPLDGDNRTPHGPCLGGTRQALTSSGQSGYELTTEQLPVDTLVLLVFTDGGPWIAAWEGA